MPTESSTDVLICGAGAAGLTLAIELTRRGVAFRLIEKMDDAFRGSRGKGIQPRTQEVFEDLGILDRVAAAGGFYPPQRAYREDGSSVDTPMEEDRASTSAEPYGKMLLIPQFITEGIMRDRLAELGHAPHCGYEMTGFEQDATGVTIRLDGKDGPKTIRALYLIGADGGRSFVRAERHALKAYVAGVGLGSWDGASP